MKNIDILGFDDRLFRLIIIPVMAFFVPIIFFGKSLSDLSSYFPVFLISLYYSIIYINGNRAILVWFRKKYPDHSDEFLRLRHQLMAMLAFILITCFFSENLLHFFFTREIFTLPPLVGYMQSQAAGLLLSAIVIGIYETIYYVQKFQETKVESEQLKRANIQSQLDTLKNQVNPHFLFNSLNTLATIIPEDQDLSVQFVQKLSKVYRYILEIKNLQMISLREELSFLNSYVFLLRIRHGDTLQINIIIPDELMEDKLVPLSMQILVENAIKHNIISTQKPLTIDVFVEGENIIVKNNLQKKRQVVESTKTGLDNIRDRYRLLSDKVVETIVTTGSFMVSLPIIKTKVV